VIEEIRNFFESYAKTYDAFDVREMSSYVTCPLVTVYEGKATHHGSPREVEEFFSQLLVWFRSIEHGTASVSALDVQALGQKSAFASIVWRSTRSDGTTFSEWPTAYHLVKSENGWKILAIILRYEPARETALA
jgi:ketosteroid isomerase-like protein